MADGSFNRRDFLGISGGFTGALLGSRFIGGLIPNAHADSPGTSTKPVPPPDLTGRDGIPFVDCSKYRGVKEDLGRYIYLAPEKLGGGSHAVDLYQGKTLAWISYWAYGDTCPISHHLAASSGCRPECSSTGKTRSSRWATSRTSADTTIA